MYCIPTAPDKAFAIADAQGKSASIGASIVAPELGVEAWIAFRAARLAAANEARLAASYGELNCRQTGYIT